VALFGTGINPTLKLLITRALSLLFYNSITNLFVRGLFQSVGYYNK
jgi:hypothetical protein